MSRIGLIVILALMFAPAWGQVPAQNSEKRPGIGVDAQGGQVVDPTKNVGDLVNALKEMLKELRTSDKELFDAKLKAVQDLGEQRSKYDRELLKVDADRLDAEARLRAEFSAAIAATEKTRVDSIRLVDTSAVAIANERATATAASLAKNAQDSAQVLSAQVTKSADDVRTLVKTTADEQSRNLQQQFSGIQTQFTAFSTRLTALEQAGAEGIGKQKFQDPALAGAITEIRSLAQSIANTSGKDAGINTTWALVGTIVVMLLMFGGLLMNMRAKAK